MGSCYLGSYPAQPFSFANCSTDFCVSLPTQAAVNCSANNLNLYDPPSIYSYHEASAVYEPVLCALYNTTYSHRSDVTGGWVRRGGVRCWTLGLWDCGLGRQGLGVCRRTVAGEGQRGRVRRGRSGGLGGGGPGAVAGGGCWVGGQPAWWALRRAQQRAAVYGAAALRARPPTMAARPASQGSTEQA